MEIRISYTINESDENYQLMCRGVRLHSGHRGLATKQEVIDFLVDNGTSSIEDLISHAMEVEEDK